MTRIFIKTYGCQANFGDSEVLAGVLKNENFEIVDNEKRADFVIVNSCSVKNKTQSKILDYIKKNKNKKIIVGGCLTKTINLRDKFPNIHGLFDTNSITKVPEIIKEKKDIFSNKKEERILIPVVRMNKEIAIINISQGCLDACTFCATKLARGMLKSYRVGDIKRAVEKSVRTGAKGIYLTSQDNGCYGFDIKTNLPDLLKELVSIDGKFMMRVGMMNPWHLKKIEKKLLDIYESTKIMKFLHIPVQSGSEKVLKEMKRKHTVEEFKEIVKKFREKFPGGTIATDIIVGYPTETEDDFQKTIELIRETKPEVLNVSKFSSRPKTKASKLKQIPSEIIKERTKILDDIYKEYIKKISRRKSLGELVKNIK